MNQLPLSSALVCLVLAVVAGASCSRRVDEDVDHAHEPSFAEQAQTVRDGRSTQIRLDTTEVDDDDLRHLEGLQEKLRRVNLSRTHITDAGLARLCAMRRLEQLRLASPNVHDEGLKNLQGLKNLRFLHLISTPITDAGLDQLHTLTSLESLYLDDTKVTDEGLGRLVAVLPKVHLHIDDHHHPLDPHAGEHSH
jgi:Leucine Rich repeat